ncbi:Rne/Rng family ribonuclease [Aquicella lusitana]|uniref:Ribonuclease E n=1 Tax=Aquicella lusitana TaxID=254246 RepID=A0A370GZM6_9COXI|nr:Rne/Rng family ribonuclease [Aquicella lusitana]RDI48767.1 ribonuclease E [Aquicella lusitana]VVC73195.1 Ribonuclease E [Aquicella lusitana]
MNRMLINATHKEEELRIALASGQYLYDLIIESTSREQKQSNIYKGKVTRIEPSLEAAFVDYGEERHGFLPLKEVARACFKKSFVDSGRRPSITEVLEEGQELVVQVEKEERGNKGAALTTFITLPGCYLVLMPNNPRAGGVSRRIEGDERDELHGILSSLQVPEGMGLIIRTAGGGRSLEELQWDLEILFRLWDVVQKAAQDRPAPFLIYQEGNAVIRALRDYLRKDIDEILIDHPDVYEDVVNHLKLIRPDFVNRVKLYKDPTPLFTRFQIESQIESAFQRDVRLPSGGSIIIDHTEALVSIDINSAKSTKGGDIEETALMTNLEAANEIARQLRLRDIGGLIVIDFIDMTPIRNQREVEDRLRKALIMDRARVQVGRISRFGLLEMSRQRLRPSLGESSRVTCPRCLGQGTIRGIESLGLSVIRIIEEEALKENTAQVRTILPTEIAAYLLNEKRQAIIDIEKRQGVSIIVVPSNHLLTPQYEVERIRLSDITEKDEKLASYKLAIKPEISSQITAPVQKTHQEPAIKSMPMEEMPAPSGHFPPSAAASKEKGEPGLLKKLFTYLFEKKEEEPEAPVQEDRFKKHGRPMRPTGKRKGGRHHHRGGRRDHRDRGRQGGGGYRNYEQRGETRHKDRETHEHKDQRETKDHQDFRDTRDQGSRETREFSRTPDTRPDSSTNLPQVIEPQQHLPEEQRAKTPKNDIPTESSNIRPFEPVAKEGSTQPGERAERRPRPRFKPHRHKHHHKGHAAKHDQGESPRHNLEGEDIYKTGGSGGRTEGED